jgi:hypothetical protein
MTLLATPIFEPTTANDPCGYRKSSMYPGRLKRFEKSLVIECEESRMSRTFVWAPALACSSCRSSAVEGCATRKVNSSATATRCRVIRP